MVGDGPVHKEILEIASNDCDIKFLGFQTPENIKKLYKNARALLLPSYKTETWGLVVNEAMCSRRCVAISTEVGCANTLVQENRNGYLFDPRNIDSIKDTLFKIERLSYDEISSFGNNSQEIIKEWTLEKFSKNLYKALCFAEKQKKHGDMVSRILCQIWKGKLNEMEKV